MNTLSLARPTACSQTAAVELTTLSPADWDGFLGGFDDALHEQSAAFLQARWGAHRCAFFKVSQGGQVLGGAGVVLLKVPVIGGGLAIVKWGPVWRKAGEPADPARLEKVLSALKAELYGRRRLHLTVMPRAEPSWPGAAVEALERLGFRRGAKLPAPARYFVNVDQPLSGLRQSLSQKWRYNLKKAEKNAFSVRLTDADEGLAPFMALYEEMLARKGFSDHSAIATLPAFCQSAPAALQPIFVHVEHSGRLCASAVIHRCGDTAAYLYGATSDDALTLRAGYALHWAVAERLCADPAIKWYDLGGNDLDAGLHQFKSGFLGKTGVQMECPEDYHVSASLKAALVARAAFFLRRAKQQTDRLLSALKARIGR
ncbi:lipid II:glycine glycyltransferase FemX [Pseudovibrio sp. SPO723]|uniref:lipid II:glycine glycyltransferase FemX n=1 Tax=Nesiotobacter zosterae TaxID=392721 RepID=UPI0029C26ED2|nr:peptidoglycan bridge formation glycyltransferase FemA/FemB family protein [Pseudovibrio sp. SPO723]MDX5593300.1 peptidoglycan bridge formation glycyltransferase FemA/FemB family protein [Pseudovibrio sp. SPO723]